MKKYIRERKKVCAECGEEKPINEFKPEAKYKGDMPMSRCKHCRDEAKKSGRSLRKKARELDEAY